METVADYEYSTKDLIGHGAFAVVFKGRHRQRPDQVVAIKSITKKNIAKSQSLLGKEIKILKELTELHHENVVALLCCHETSNHVYLVMEYCNGGDLADYLQAKGTLSEDTIRFFLRQLAESMRALFQKDIVHRDLKPQNILLAHNKPNPHPHQITLKIADFGFARFLQDGVMAATLCGSPMYMAPEVIMSLQYDAKADLWSLGTIVFQCLTGKAPFQAQTPQALKLYYEKNANLAPKIPVGTSPELVNLLMGLLKRNARDRMSFEMFFNHAFIRGAPVNRPSAPHKPTSGSAVPIPTQPATSIPKHPVRDRNSQPAQAQVAIAKEVPNTTQGQTLIGEDTEMAADDRGPPVRRERYSVPTQNVNVTPSIPRPVPRKMTEPPAASAMEEAEDFVMVPSTLPADPEASKIPQAWNTRNRRIGLNAHNYSSPTSRPSQITNYDARFTNSTNSNSSTESYRSGDPLPVPSQRATFHQMISSGSNEQIFTLSDSPQNSGTSPIPNSIIPRSKPINARRPSDGRHPPDVASLSPPAVQFTIGTPPCGRRRSTSGSSHSGTPPMNIPGSPTKVLANTAHRDNVAGDICGNLPQFASENATTNVPLAAPHRVHTMPEMTSRNNQSGPLDMSLDGSTGSGLHRSRTDSQLQDWQMSNATSPLHYTADKQSIQYGQSAPAFLGRTSPMDEAAQQPIFYAPPLHAETLMEREHNETLAKLNFVLALVDTIFDLAKSRAAPLNVLQSSNMRESMTGSTREENVERSQLTPEWQRRAEQLVLYVRSLQLLSTALNLAKSEKALNKLQPSNAVKSVVAVLNERFRTALQTCKHLNSSGTVLPSDSRLSSITADKLIYNYAIEMCQSAALDELFGKPEECFRRYQAAQILLHSLAQHVAHESDRHLLTKYKRAVERRLFLLTEQGVVHAYSTVET